MILQVLADAGQRYAYIDGMGIQFGRIADAGKHQELRRVNHSTGEQHFTLRPRDVALAVLQILDADGTAPVKDDMRGESVDQDVEVGASEAPAGDRRSRHCNAIRCEWSFAGGRSPRGWRRCNPR